MMEDRRRMRWEKAQQRAQKQAQRRRLFLRLGIAGVVLIGSIILILMMTRDTTSDQPDSAAQTPTAAPTEASYAADNTTVIHYAAAGDLNITDAVVQSGLAASGYDFTRSFMDVAPVCLQYD